MFMAFHSSERRKPFLIAIAVSLLLIGAGIGVGVSLG
jgi:hypothetical protein